MCINWKEYLVEILILVTNISFLQVYNFLRFCEMVVKKSKNVRNIKLVTGLEEVR